MTDPTEEDLRSPVFNAIWQAIKRWDISRDTALEGYHGVTGTDVMAILIPLREAGLVIEDVVAKIGELDS